MATRATLSRCSRSCLQTKSTRNHGTAPRGNLKQSPPLPLPLPPDLQALAQQAQPPLQSAAVRLAPSDLARVEALRARLGCRRSAVLRGLLLTGLAAVESQQRGEVVIHG